MLPFKTITILSGTVAALSVLAIPMWALGVPGVEGNYMRGWKRGFGVIQLYPLAWVVTYAPYFALRNRFDDLNRGRFQAAVSVIALLLLLVATVRMVQAFQVMLDKSPP